MTPRQLLLCAVVPPARPPSLRAADSTGVRNTALYRAGVIARRCEKRKKDVILNSDIPLGDLGCGMFLEAIPDSEKQWLLDNLQPIRLPSSPPLPSSLLVPTSSTRE